jgi:hypothetical protein
MIGRKSPYDLAYEVFERDNAQHSTAGVRYDGHAATRPLEPGYGGGDRFVRSESEDGTDSLDHRFPPVIVQQLVDANNADDAAAIGFEYRKSSVPRSTNATEQFPAIRVCGDGDHGVARDHQLMELGIRQLTYPINQIGLILPEWIGHQSFLQHSRDASLGYQQGGIGVTAAGKTIGQRGHACQAPDHTGHTKHVIEQTKQSASSCHHGVGV